MSQIETLILMGNIETRLGFLDQGFANFERAVRISRLHELHPELVRALNARGWACRSQGRHDDALRDYLEAYQGSLLITDWQQTVRILTNISFISALSGDRQAAFESALSAVKLSQRSVARREEAAAYSNLGAVHVRFNEPHEALEAYTRALNLIDNEQDIDLISLIRCGRAYAYQLQGAFREATEDLIWAMVYGPVNLRPRILYTQALVERDSGNLLQARDKLVVCRELSREIGDQFNDFKSFADLIELVWEFGEYDHWSTYARELDELYSMQQGTEAKRLRGSCLRKLGDLAVFNGDYDAALAFYEEGYPLIAENEIHARYTIRSQMQQSDDRMRGRVPAKIMSRLGHGLAQCWRSTPMLVVKYPEALLTFQQWIDMGAQEDHEAVAYR
ncbi:MAG: tetratricopeptide repeat protein [Chloroflexaceae bacterium]|nr:tetratricopeptide repeat protein [Chloroflexaceae bacterium]